MTSLGGAGKVKKGRTVHGMSNPLRDTQKAGKHMDVEYDTPFDELGRCHHHPRVQMATKKVRGGWKILITACPKCIEARYDEECSVTSSKSGGSRRSKGGKSVTDDGSVSSRSTKRSVVSRSSAVAPGCTYDKNGCCTKHPSLQVAKKKLLGGWKEFRSCPKCLDPSYDDMSENASVSSKRSTTSFRSTGSRKSSRSVKSNTSRKGGRKTDRYGKLPFDEDGYCHAHPSVRIAKKKPLGGWKVSNSELCSSPTICSFAQAKQSHHIIQSYHPTPTRSFTTFVLIVPTTHVQKLALLDLVDHPAAADRLVQVVTMTTKDLKRLPSNQDVRQAHRGLVRRRRSVLSQ